MSSQADKRHAQPSFDATRPLAGEAVSASEFRRLKALVNDLCRQQFTYGSITKIKLFRLTDPISPEPAATGDWTAQTGIVQWWDATTKTWKDEKDENDVDVTRESIANLLELAIENEGRVVAGWHKQAAMWVPMQWATGLVALTPAGGIPARSGLVLGGPVKCKMFWDTGNMGATATLAKVAMQDGSDWELDVYNITPSAIAEAVYLGTDLLMSGRRYAIVEPC